MQTGFRSRTAVEDTPDEPAAVEPFPEHPDAIALHWRGREFSGRAAFPRVLQERFEDRRDVPVLGARSRQVLRVRRFQPGYQILQDRVSRVFAPRAGELRARFFHQRGPVHASELVFGVEAPRHDLVDLLKHLPGCRGGSRHEERGGESSERHEAQYRAVFRRLRNRMRVLPYAHGGTFASANGSFHGLHLLIRSGYLHPGRRRFLDAPVRKRWARQGMNLPTLRGDQAADVALLVEGTYPFARGSASNWVHKLIESMPRTTFSIVSIAGRRMDQRTPAYQLPSNVVHFESHHLSSLERVSEGPASSAMGAHSATSICSSSTCGPPSWTRRSIPSWSSASRSAWGGPEAFPATPSCTAKPAGNGSPTTIVATAGTSRSRTTSGPSARPTSRFSRSRTSRSICRPRGSTIPCAADARGFSEPSFPSSAAGGSC